MASPIELGGNLVLPQPQGNIVICQPWEVSSSIVEKDGFSLHTSLDGMKRFIDTYWNGMSDSLPQRYARPSGEPYVVDVSDEVLDELEASGDGLRYTHPDVPGKPEIDRLQLELVAVSAN